MTLRPKSLAICGRGWKATKCAIPQENKHERILRYPLIQNDYRQEKKIFELFSGALQENPVRAPGAITGGALTLQGPIQETIFGELFWGALQENPVIAPGQLPEKMFTELFW